jgi:putative ABC transport system permease protein
MNAMLGLAARSAWNRRFVLSLVALSIALSTFLLLSIERVRTDLRQNFVHSVSGTDLIVGARTGSVQLLLYAVFHLGSATNNIRWSSAEAIARHRAVAWAVPIALGDSHRGFPVLATTPGYFEHVRHGDRQPLMFAQGKPFAAVFDAVLGADVAERLGYGIGDRVVLSHGDGVFSANEHADKPFIVTGILRRSGTPADRAVHIGLEGLEAVHHDWVAGTPIPALSVPAGDVERHDLEPKSVTAVLIGLHNRAAALSLQRQLSEQEGEPLMAILPGVALDELWQVVDVGERALQAMTVLVALVSLGGLIAVILAGLEQRRRELAILRAVGASPGQVLMLLACEGAIVTVAGVVVGIAIHFVAVYALGEWARQRFGIALDPGMPGFSEVLFVAAALASGFVASLIPGYRAYRLSLADGLTPKV